MDFVVERCEIQVVRAGGRPWGPERTEMVESVVRALPHWVNEALAEWIETHLGNWEERTIDQVTATVALRTAELRFLELGLAPAQAPAASLPRRVSEALRRSLEKSDTGSRGSSASRSIEPSSTERVPSARDSDVSSPSASRGAQTAYEPQWSDAEMGRAWQATVLRALLRFRQLGQLNEALASAPESLLSVWHTAVFEPSAGQTRHDPERLPDVHEVRSQLNIWLQQSSALPSSPLAVRLSAGLELSARYSLLPDHPVLRAALDDCVKLPTTSPGAPSFSGGVVVRDTVTLQTRSEAPASTASERATGLVPSAAIESNDGSERATVTKQHASPLATPRQGQRSPVAARSDVELEVTSVLPFLVLGELARMGYIDVLHATLRGVAPDLDSKYVALAFAFKLLAPPERGWLISPAVERTACAFAALDGPLDSQPLNEVVRRLDASLSPADDFLRASLLEGHRVGVPWLLVTVPVSCGGGVVLLDRQGLFPLGWAPDLKRLFASFGDALRREVVGVAGACATPQCLTELHALGLRFVTDAPPAESESWRTLRRGSVQLSTNDRRSAESRLFQLAEDLTNARRLTLELWTSLGERPCTPRVRYGGLERAITLAAAVGLGAIAWQLWREREPTDPLLAWERMTSLDGRVRLTDDQVIVKMPLGRRYQDLYQHGLTRDVRGIPWLDGRTVVLTTG